MEASEPLALVFFSFPLRCQAYGDFLLKEQVDNVDCQIDKAKKGLDPLGLPPEPPENLIPCRKLVGKEEQKPEDLVMWTQTS
ncbi:hypothetical protein STEG23_015559 [Scotinomys teguina]